MKNQPKKLANQDLITPTDQELIKIAKNLLKKTYHKGRHVVAAALRTEDGQIYTGVNLDVSGYGPCAEPVAIGQAITSQAASIECMVAVAYNDEQIKVISPCGNCRQLMFDYYPNALVIVPSDGDLLKITTRQLLPYPYIT